MPRRAETGYTLIELLVALALLGLLSILLFAGLRDGARSWAAIRSHADSAEQTIAAQRLLREQLAGVLRGPGAAGFAGGPGGLAMVTVWLEHLPVAGSHRVEISLAAAGTAGRSLVFAWSPVRPTGVEASPAAGEIALAGRRTLLDGITRAEFRYWGDPAEEGTAAWHASWVAPQPPDLVRIDLDFADSRRSWPTLIVAVP